MATIEERVSYLEGKVEEHSRGIMDLRGLIERLDEKVDRVREELSGQIHRLDEKVDRVREELSGQIHRLDDRVARQFTWLVGLHVGTLVAIVGALLAR